MIASGSQRWGAALAPLALLIALSSLGSLGCTGMTNGGPLVIGPYELPPRETFGRLIEAARREGYPPLSIDYPRGSFRVRPRHVSSAQDAFLLVQCSRRGWVQVRPVGRRVLGEGGELRLDSELDAELHQLAVIFSRALSPQGSPAGEG